MRIVKPSILNKIYVSIAAYNDLELYPTVYDLFKKAKNPKSIYVSIFAQDDDPPDLQPIFDEFGITEFNYTKVPTKQARGVGYARSMTQRDLSTEYKYYLQIDSHSRFEQYWDTKIIKDYDSIASTYDKYIMSSYPPGYVINDDGTEELLPEIDSLMLIRNEQYGFEPKRIDHPGLNTYAETAYFAAGQAFGLSEYFLEVPYDPSLYFNGEEQLLSVRFFEKGIHIVCAPRYYLYHDYDGTRRKRVWDKHNTEQYEKASSERIDLFLKTGLMGDPFGLKSLLPLIVFYNKFVENELPDWYVE